jgi:hypothetical protein
LLFLLIKIENFGLLLQTLYLAEEYPQRTLIYAMTDTKNSVLEFRKLWWALLRGDSSPVCLKDTKNSVLEFRKLWWALLRGDSSQFCLKDIVSSVLKAGKLWWALLGGHSSQFCLKDIVRFVLESLSAPHSETQQLDCVKICLQAYPIS